MAYEPYVSPLSRPRKDKLASYYNEAQRAPITVGSVSLTDDPAMTRNIDAAKRDKSLLTRQYTRLRRAGDYAGAMNIARQADEMGLPVGRPSNDDEVRGAGAARYLDDLRRTGGTPKRGGLSGFDFNQRGYDAMLGESRLDSGRQAGDTNENPTVPAEPAMDADPVERLYRDTSLASAAEGEPDAQAKGPTLDRAAGWRKAWQAAKTPEEKADVVERAASYGIGLSKAGQETLSRRRQFREHEAAVREAYDGNVPKERLASLARAKKYY